MIRVHLKADQVQSCLRTNRLCTRRCAAGSGLWHGAQSAGAQLHAGNRPSCYTLGDAVHARTSVEPTDPAL